MSAKLDELAQLLKKQAQRQVPIQTEWCIVKEVDWEDKTMTVESLVNGLEYFDVLLGLGSMYRKPEVDTKVLIGLIANTEACFMLDCEAFTDIELVNTEGFKISIIAKQLTIEDTNGFVIDLHEGNLTLNGDGLGGIVKADVLKTQIDKNTAILQAIQNAITAWTPVSQDGGAAFKAGLATVPSMQRADLINIKNDTIKHGN